MCKVSYPWRSRYGYGLLGVNRVDQFLFELYIHSYDCMNMFVGSNECMYGR